MIKIILLLIYLWDGELVIEQKAYVDTEACVKAGAARAEIIESSPKFGGGVLAGCIAAKVTDT
jgi:hypothetical protein